MKLLVVYYSLENNTELVANLIKDNFDVDLLRLQPKRDLNKNSFTKYVFGGFQAITKCKPKLKDYQVNVDNYDYIIIGTPVWASTYSPTIRTFINSHKITDKNIAIYACHRGGPGKTIPNLKQDLPGNNFIGELEIVQPCDQQESNLKNNIISWINEIIKK